jgi:hypothetical protein
MNEYDLIEEMDNQDFWQQAQEDEQQQAEDWQSILSNDPGYVAWAEEMDRQTLEDQEIMELAHVEDERNFRTLQPWD